MFEATSLPNEPPPLPNNAQSQLTSYQQTVRPDWAIYWTLGNFSEHLAKINLPKCSAFLGNFCSEIIFGQLLQTFGDFLLVTLLANYICNLDDKRRVLFCCYSKRQKIKSLFSIQISIGFSPNLLNKVAKEIRNLFCFNFLLLFMT